MKSNVVGWFEIPVADMDRAIKFYEKVFGFTIDRHTMDSVDMGWFPWVDDGTGAGGSLVKADQDFYRPSAEGTLVYFTADSGDLSNELARVVPAGGKVLVEKRLIGEGFGYMAVVTDTEGNRIALHSRE
jgi:predicted enzyme related to lactoylglutathione lyase